VADRRPDARRLFLIHGDDPYRARLRAAELVGALTKGEDRPSDLRTQRSPDLGAPLGLTRHDARSAEPAAIEMSGRAQGLFDAVDEQRIVVVEHAEALRDGELVARLPPEAAFVLVSETRIAPRGRRGAKAKPDAATDVAAAVEAAGGAIEHIAKLGPAELQGWIAARATLLGIEVAPDAITELASATGPDTERIDHELEKLGAYASGARVTGDDVRTLVNGAIETDVFRLTEAIVRGKTGEALDRLGRLLEAGQAEQQILALLLWQFRVLLFASAMRSQADAERMAKAIHSSSSYSIEKWQAFARGVPRARVLRAYEAIYATDLAIKTGRTDPETAMMLCVLDLCGVSAADPRELVVGEPPRR
jgi:DNA polymerase III delta subunit